MGGLGQHFKLSLSLVLGSGTLVATELAIQTLIANKTPNLINIVKSLRQRRISSVQTDLQYAFIYKVVLAFIATKEPDSETSKVNRLASVSIDTYFLSSGVRRLFGHFYFSNTEHETRTTYLT